MRKDFSKILVERSRLGGKYERKGRVPKRLSDLPSKVSMKASHSDRKHLNENLSPLKRFLEKNIGKKWDSVFSEICENIKVSSTVQKHVRDHIKDFVQTNIQINGKKIMFQRAYFGGFVELYDGFLYVDSKGYLRQYRREKPKKTSNTKNPEKVLFSLSNSKTVLIDDKIYKVYKNPDNDTWSLYNSATEAHARLDFASLPTHSLQTYFARNPMPSKSKYIQTLWELFSERNARLKELEATQKSLQLGQFKVGEDVLVKPHNKDKAWRHGVVTKTGLVNPILKISGYEVVMDDGKKVAIPFGSEDTLIRSDKPAPVQANQ